MKLWLDDVRPAPDGWTWAKTAREALKLITAHCDEITDVSLDHDLGASPEDGMSARGSHPENGNHVAQYIARYKLLEPGTPIRIHSWNPDGARTMAYWLSEAGYLVEVRPYDLSEVS